MKAATPAPPSQGSGTFPLESDCTPPESMKSQGTKVRRPGGLSRSMRAAVAYMGPTLWRPV
ncbi:hypothetical protein GCM10009548_06440 [Streptomyces malaysiensis subsp. malaysiensis]